MMWKLVLGVFIATGGVLALVNWMPEYWLVWAALTLYFLVALVQHVVMSPFAVDDDRRKVTRVRRCIRRRMRAEARLKRLKTWHFIHTQEDEKEGR